MVSIKKKTLLDTVEFLTEQEEEQHAQAVLKVAIEKSLMHMGVYTPIISQLPFVFPKKEHVEKLKKLDLEIRKEFDDSSTEVTFEKILDYLYLVSNITENPHYSYRKLMASILERRSIKRIRVPRRKDDIKKVLKELLAEGEIQIIGLESGQEERKYYTTSEAAKKLGLSDQTIRRMCERGKFIGASRVGGDGHWRIPDENFITTGEQDKKAEQILQQIDKKNTKAGDIDEFDL